ncbi:hypothetical protein FA95DRAFT_884590 [Auriscalpium vulgare]|uniref:Uncharacterized protein n=1 Tax=Auriscalpium vulgare TaxID=40419 RepID=A0ACB8R8H2_9AGAM|nr:hypothetical protein FA95DRAFT_884590 [Auriscalpium vulgare]
MHTAQWPLYLSMRFARSLLLAPAGPHACVDAFPQIILFYRASASCQVLSRSESRCLGPEGSCHLTSHIEIEGHPRTGLRLAPSLKSLSNGRRCRSDGPSAASIRGRTSRRPPYLTTSRASRFFLAARLRRCSISRTRAFARFRSCLGDFRPSLHALI